ncbi:MAG: septum formation initiator family protein [bacterium]
MQYGNWKKTVVSKNNYWWWLVLLIVVIGGCYFVIREWRARYDIDQQITDLKQQVEAVKADNGKAKDLLDLVNNPYFVEAQLRLKLGKQKPGERAVVVPETTAVKAQEDKQAEEPLRSKWSKFFFK